jgi:hypothetical protein
MPEWSAARWSHRRFVAVAATTLVVASCDVDTAGNTADRLRSAAMCWGSTSLAVNLGLLAAIPRRAGRALVEVGGSTDAMIFFLPGRLRWFLYDLSQ